MHANALMFISNLAKQILIRGYLLLEFLDFRQKQTFLLNKCFLLEMAYELLSQSRKLTKAGGEEGGGIKSGCSGDWKMFWKKTSSGDACLWEKLSWDLSYEKHHLQRTIFASNLILYDCHPLLIFTRISVWSDQ